MPAPSFPHFPPAGLPTAMHTPPAILFDLDDTLVAFDAVSAPAWAQVTHAHAAHIGIQASTLLEAIDARNRWYWSDPERHRLGRHNLPHTRRQLVHAALAELGHRDEARNHALADAYTTLRTELMHLLPGAHALLTALRSRGTRLGLVTNGTAAEQRQKIDRFALAPHFDFIQVEGELGMGKPEDGAYRHALARIGTPAHLTWFVGDNLEWDVRAPQRHGMTGVWVDRHGDADPPPPQPHHRVRDLRELGGLLGIEV